MKKVTAIVFMALITILFNGCLYNNECGLSPYYYDEKKSYYDSQGNYIEKCPERNVYKFENAQDGDMSEKELQEPWKDDFFE